MPDAPPPPGHLARLIDALCDRIEDGWKTGRPPALEALLPAVPAEHRPRAFRELLAAERAARAAAGRPLTRADAQARFAPLGAWAADTVAEVLADDPAVVLEVTAGPHAGAVFPLAGAAAVTVGRNPGLPVPLPHDGRVSKVHCLIEVAAPAARLTDLGSRHGTYLNGRRVADRAELRDGDAVGVGDTTIRVRAPSGAAADTLTATLGPGFVRPGAAPPVPGYEVGGELGRGAAGVVYRAVRPADGRTVALKVVHPAVAPAPAAVARFFREADLLARLDHPNVVRLEDRGSAGAALYVAMEYVAGRTAGAVVAAGGPVAPDRALGWAAQLLDALAHAHDRGVVHRDVKPANLLVAAGPGGEVLKVADFGLAKAYQEASLSGLTGDRAAGGTPSFLPPEQVEDFKRAGPAADQYGAAATLYYVLTGRTVYPPAGSVPELLRRVLTEDPEPLRAGGPPLPGRFGPVLARALARDPAARFPDVRAMAAALRGGDRGPR